MNVGHALPVNLEYYVGMVPIDELLLPELQNFSDYNQRTWFKQGGATSYMSIMSLPRVRETFPGKIISRRGDINCLHVYLP